MYSRLRKARWGWSYSLLENDQGKGYTILLVKFIVVYSYTFPAAVAREDKTDQV